MQLPTADDVADAARRIAGHVVHTPMLRNALLDHLTGGTILLKPEVLQRTGSFKLRGATNAAMQLTDSELRAGVVAHSSGNHGQALACAAAVLGARATVFMPADAPRVKVDSTRRWGADIVHYDRVTDDREAMTAAFAARTGASLIPPFDHPHVMAGQGTLALELITDARDGGFEMDTLLVCTGGGGMIAGCALAALKVHVHLCFTSPKVRARDTAVLACQALGIHPLEHATLFAGFDVDDARELLAIAGTDQRVLVIGHEPDFSQIVHDLTGARLLLTSFTGADVTEARFDGAHLRAVSFHDATATRVSFRGATLDRCDLTGAELTDADWTEATLIDTARSTA